MPPVATNLKLLIFSIFNFITAYCMQVRQMCKKTMRVFAQSRIVYVLYCKTSR
jgi:hypothetical protein